jgi:hypothetical protein
MERWITKEEIGLLEENACGKPANSNDSDAPLGVA